MIGPILLGISWLLLRLEGRDLRALGIDQPRRRLREFLLGFLAIGLASAAQQLGVSALAADPFVRNPGAEPAGLLNLARFIVNSVLYEELLFRGYLLYQAMRRLGAARGALLSAAAFGVYHWFSYGIVGQLVPMAYVFLLTGAFGYLWARAFAATGSVLAPIGMHLGWNAIAQLVFSAGPLGPALLVPASGAPVIAVGGWASLGLNVLLPGAVVAGGLQVLRRVEETRDRLIARGADKVASENR